jgi:hypothetical protein
VHRRVREAHRLPVGPPEELEQLHHEPRRRGADPGDPGDHVRRRERLVRDVQPDHDDVPPGPHDDARGLGVGADVELRDRGPVARPVGAAHEHDLPHAVDDPRLGARRQGDVGQRPGRHEGHRPGVARHHRLHDDLDRVPGIERQYRLGEHRAVEPRLPVDARRVVPLPDQRAVGARRERHPGDPADPGHGQGVPGDAVEGLVAGDGRDGQQLDLRAAVREQQGDGVVVPGVAVQDDRVRHAASSPVGPRASQPVGEQVKGHVIPATPVGNPPDTRAGYARRRPATTRRRGT